MTDKQKDLVQIIRDNPGCVAVVDNDCWVLYKAGYHDHPKFTDHEEAGEWQEKNELAADGEVITLGDGGYGSGPSYGADILQALAVIVGIKIESV